MTDTEDRFDALLDAMLTKPPLDGGSDQQDGQDLRESEQE